MILVTGGAGFVGLNVAEQLLARGDEVAILDLRPPPKEFSNAAFVQGDVTDRDCVAKAFSRYRIRRVIHLSAITAGAERDAREPRRIAEVNLIGTLNLLEAARDHQVERFMHASTGAVYGAAGVDAPEPLHEERDRPLPEGMYAITKYAAERSALRLAALWNMDVRVGRLATAFGKWEHDTGVRDRLSPPTEIARLALQGGEAVFPPTGATDYIYAPDLARAILLLADAGAPAHRLYHLGDGRAWRLPRWCKVLARRFPKFRWREAEEGCNVRPLTPVARIRFDNRRAAQDLGYTPRFDLAAAADDFVSWLETRQ